MCNYFYYLLKILTTRIIASMVAIIKIIDPIVEKPSAGMGIPLPDWRINDEPTIKDEIISAIDILSIILSSFIENLSRLSSFISIPISPFLALRSV